MMVLVHGHPIFFYDDVANSSHVYSVRKSILAMLYGNYVTNGRIDLSKTIKQLGITDKQPLLPIEETATLRQLLASRSGVYHPSGSFGQADYMPKRGLHTPGTYYVYNNWDFNDAGVAFEKLTGHSIYQELQTDLANPIGMQDYRASEQKKEFMPESSLGEYAMSLSTRDMARLGLLMLDKGDHVNRHSQPRYTPGLPPQRFRSSAMGIRLSLVGVGLSRSAQRPRRRLRRFLSGSLFGDGHGGNFITILPAFSVVVVH